MTRLITSVLIFCSLLEGPHSVSGDAGRKIIQIHTIERLVHINPPGLTDSRYAYVPFDVPPHAVRIKISYQYDRADGANTMDIGLFDARSTSSDTDSRGFRGWSGGRRSEFFVSRAQATPGYQPGELMPGTWRIILGLYQVRPAGVDVSFKIEIETDGDRGPGNKPATRKTDLSATQTTNYNVPAISLRQTVAGQRLRWFRGDLHLHTIHSDGDWTVDELVRSARTSSLDFICVTDHNTSSHHADVERARSAFRDLLILRGEEITTYGGHSNAWGLPSGVWIDFRTRPGDNARMASIAAQVHRAGGLISINHPFGLCSGCNWSYDDAVRYFDGVEIWNGVWDQTDEQALTMWDKILQAKRHITAIASSDSHRPANPIGHPTTRVAANNLSQAEILKAVRQGRVYLTGEQGGLLVSFEAEARTVKRRTRWIIGDEVHLSSSKTVGFFVTTAEVPSDAKISLISNGQVIRSLPVRMDGQPHVIEIDCQFDSYFRLEIRDGARKMLALTNPIYVKIR